MLRNIGIFAYLLFIYLFLELHYHEDNFECPSNSGIENIFDIQHEFIRKLFHIIFKISKEYANFGILYRKF